MVYCTTFKINYYKDILKITFEMRIIQYDNIFFELIREICITLWDTIIY